jgi:hypothetical protein
MTHPRPFRFGVLASATAGDRFDEIEISILKFVTVVTDDRDAVAEKVGAAMGMDAATLDAFAPVVAALAGT